MSNVFTELSKVDCSKHVEQKGRFTYLSWPFAFSELYSRYPNAIIEMQEWDGFPAIRGCKGWMVKASVTIGDVRKSQWHPVLDNNNKAIAEPDVFQINTSIQRACVKAIALHGLGLYIYAGEDLPEVTQVSPLDGAWDAMSNDQKIGLEGLAITLKDFHKAGDMAGCVNHMDVQKLDGDEKKALWTRLDSKIRAAIKKEIEGRK